MQQELETMEGEQILTACKTVEDLDLKFRIQEGLLEFPKDTKNIYNGQLALAAERVEEALHFIVRHIRQQKSLDPPNDCKQAFFKMIRRA